MTVSRNAPNPHAAAPRTRAPGAGKIGTRGRSVGVAQKPSKLLGRVRFPSPACRRGVAQSGSAPGWGPGGRWFESSLPDSRIGSVEPISGVVGTIVGTLRAVDAPGLRIGGRERAVR